MAEYEVEPVRGFETQILNEYKSLPVNCANGFAVLMDILGKNNPSTKNRCGLLNDRHEIYAIPLPDCQKRLMMMSIDTKDTALPRAIHGVIAANDKACVQGAKLATRQYGLINPSWET